MMLRMTGWNMMVQTGIEDDDVCYVDLWCHSMKFDIILPFIVVCQVVSCRVSAIIWRLHNSVLIL